MANKPFLPDKAGARLLASFIGIGAIVLGVVDLWEDRGRPTGILSWLTGPIFDVAGNVGLAIFHVALGLFILFVAFRTKD